MCKKIKIEITFTAYYNPEPDMTLDDWKESVLSDYYLAIDQSTEDPVVTVTEVEIKGD